MRRLLQVLLGVLVVVALSATVQATVITQHSGATDPTTEGFVVDLSGSLTSASADNDAGAGTSTVDEGGTSTFSRRTTSTLWIRRFGQPVPPITM